MENLGDILKNYPIKKKGSERNSVLKELYSLYWNDKGSRKRGNWKKYIEYLKANRKPDSKESQTAFKKSKMYIRELSEKSFAILLAPQKLDTLYYMRSVSLDKKNRGENVSAWIINSIRDK